LEWNAAKLLLSRFDTERQSGDIIMVLEDSTVNTDNTALRVTITASKNYTYDYSFELEVFLDRRWYTIGKLYSYFDAYNDENYSTVIDSDTVRYQTIDPAHYVGSLPAGKYRLIREFLHYRDDKMLYPNKEFVYVEFNVKSTENLPG
jgi:hypothetical protein